MSGLGFYAAALLLPFVTSYVVAALAKWLLGSLTRTREPAFTAFVAACCLVLGRYSGTFDWEERGGAAMALAMTTGSILGLTLFWRTQARPERAALDERSAAG